MKIIIGQYVLTFGQKHFALMAIFLQKSPKRGLWLGGDYFFSLSLSIFWEIYSPLMALCMFFLQKMVIEVL